VSAVRTAPTLPRPDGTTPLAGRLRRRLLALDYPAFARCVCILLEALGYEAARPAGRQEWKGYNRPGGGGYDLEALLPGGVAPRRVVAQIKQYDALAVHQRSVDELRGACLRAGATEALLVTTSAFSEVVRRHALAPDPLGASVAPVRLIDGEELLALLIRHGVGVREQTRSGLRRLEIGRLQSSRSAGNRSRGKGSQGNRLDLDEAFFAMLGAVPAREPDARTMPGKSGGPGWRVTIRVTSGSCPKTRTDGSANGGPEKDGSGKGGR
jgi:hypothetical protein